MSPERTVGVMLPREVPPADVTRVARAAEDAGFDELWVVEDCFYTGGLTTATLALTATGGMPASAAPRPDYPTWAEVQAAKQNEAAKKAEIAKIEKIVKNLLVEADALAKVAMEKAEDALLAQGELQAAEAKTARLADQLTDPGTDQVHPHNRTVLAAYELDEP